MYTFHLNKGGGKDMVDLFGAEGSRGIMLLKLYSRPQPVSWLPTVLIHKNKSS